MVGENNVTYLNASKSKIFTKRHLRLRLEKLNLRLMPSLLDSLESLETSRPTQDLDRKDADSQAQGPEVDTEKSQSADS